MTRQLVDAQLVETQLVKTQLAETQLVEKLLDAHVAFVVSDISGKRLQSYLEARLDRLLGFAERLRLKDVVTPDMIKTTARRYACDVELSVAVPELAAAVGRAAHSHPVHDVTRLGDLLPDRHLQAIIDKGLELREVRDAIVHEVAENPLYADLVADVLLQTVKVHLNKQVERNDFPGVRQLLKFSSGLWGASTSQLSILIEDAARDFVSGTMRGLLHESESVLLDGLESGILRNAVLDVWQQLRERTTGSFRDMITALDVEEFFVILYEYWHGLRKTEFYGAFIDSGIDAFFEKYGESSLMDVLLEVGITRDMMLADAMRFAPHVIGVLKRKKMLESLVRAELAPFYLSGQVETLLAAHFGQNKNEEPVSP